MTTAALRRYFLMTCAATALHAGAAAAEPPTGRVGVATAVNTTAESLPSRGTLRPLLVGLDIEQGERIDTDSSGRAQLLFLDGSTITIGNRASVVVDEFVFDPNIRRGHLAMSMARGLMRFIGGYLSKDGSVTVRTPTALLGIRGAIVMIEVAPDTGNTTATLLFGDSLTVTGLSGAVEVIRRIGQSTTVGADGSPSVPRRITPDQLKPLDQTMPNNPGAPQGLPLPPSPQRAADLDGPSKEVIAAAAPSPSAAMAGGLPPMPPPAQTMLSPGMVLRGSAVPDQNALRMARQDLQSPHLPDRPGGAGLGSAVPPFPPSGHPSAVGP